MGEEIYSAPLRIKRFLGQNLMKSATSLSPMEASIVENVNITSEDVEQRSGYVELSSNTFKEKTDTDAKPITGLYSSVINGSQKQCGTGGDAFKEFVGGAWVDKTGTVTITDDKNNFCSFATFIDNAGNEVFIVCPELDAPFKWDGSGNADALISTPGDFKYPVVANNKLWVVIDDYVYISDYNNCESWNTAWDVIRYASNGENITGLYLYSDRVVVFKPHSIHVISGSSYSDLSSQEIVTGDGCASPYSIREVESRRYGNILVFLSTEGIIKGFNGSKNLLRLGDPVKPKFDQMNRLRFPYARAEVLDAKKQYWLAMSYGSDSKNHHVMAYDYENDNLTGEDGYPLSTNLYHRGSDAQPLEINAIAMFEATADEPILVTGDNSGNLFRQNYGYNDNGDPVTCKWQSGKMDFGDPVAVKLLVDLAVVTTQTSYTHVSLTATTQENSAVGTDIVTTKGSRWGYFLWGTGLWSGPETRYTRMRLAPTDGETAVCGRYFVFQMAHTFPNEAMRIEELVAQVSSLGQQPEFIE